MEELLLSWARGLNELDITGSNDTPLCLQWRSHSPVERSTTVVLLGASLKTLRPQKYGEIVLGYFSFPLNIQ